MKNVWKSFFALLVPALLMTSCFDNSTVDNPSSSAFMLANFSPGSPGLGIYINANLVDTGFRYGNYTTTYLSAAPGSYQFIYAKDSAGNAKAVDTANFTFAANAYYTVFNVDSFSRIKTTVVTDDFYKPSGDSVLVRFFHLCPDAPAINVVFDNTASSDTNGIALFPARSFNDQSFTSSFDEFVHITKGTYNISFVQVNPSVTLYKKTNVELTGGTVYTLLAKGLVNVSDTTQKLALGQIINLR